VADPKNSTKAIPVELLLAGIGQQVKVDLEAHRQRLLADIAERRQKLDELHRRRQELLERGAPAAVEELSLVGDTEVATGSSLDLAAPLADDGPDWLAEPDAFTAWDAGQSVPLADDGPDWLAGDPNPADEPVEEEPDPPPAPWDKPGGANTAATGSLAWDERPVEPGAASPAPLDDLPSLDALFGKASDLLNIDLEV